MSEEAARMEAARLLALDALRAASLVLNLCDLDGEDCEYLNSDEYPRDEAAARDKIDTAIAALVALSQGRA